MNNGKVRIYELSKELNLDNRDLLTICDQLSISVKSHSSTITETEAEKIRLAAEKFIANRPTPKPNPVRPAVNSPSVESKKQTPLNIQKKQQILEIRRPIIRSSATVSEPPDLLTPPVAQPPAAASTPPVKPVDSARPARPETVGDAAPVASDLAVRPGPESVAEVTASLARDHSSNSTAPDPITEVKPETVQSPVATPQEVAPAPTRPPAVTSARPALTNKPVLKRDRANAGAAAPVGAPPQREGRPQGAPGANRRPPAARSGDEAAPPRTQTIVELRRPRPVQPGGQAGGQDAAARGDDGMGRPRNPDLMMQAPVLRGNRPAKPAEQPVAPGAAPGLLNKPALPTKSRRGKGWEEEEEEVQEFPEKAKLGAKGKRRVQPKIDEDDDEELENLFGDAIVDPAQVSISLARPAKPKGLPGQTKAPAAVAAPTQPKKKQSNFRDRRDRREQEPKLERPEMITLTGGVTVQELAQMMSVRDTEIITTLFVKGIAATVTQTLDVATAITVAEEFGIIAEAGEKAAEARKVTEMLDVADLDSLQRRPPVVTIMGHVDHGKTTLLDSIRKTKVAAGEAGGITQHIGAYHVDMPHNGAMQQVVFLDTPGHEAFTAMRARGARVTDIAILVVAADDGVQPQTIEAISHAKAAEVPIIVAINKIDKEDAQPDRVKQELTEYNLVPEEWGGDTIMVPLSAMTGENLDTLLEMILLVAEVEDLQANPDRAAKGTVIEAHLDKAKGPVATLLIQNGTLRVGDVLVAGSSLGKVRAMVNDLNQRVQVAGPSFAVEVLGLADVPAAGDEFLVFADEKEGRAVATDKADQQRQSRLLAAMSSRRVSLNTLSAKAQEGDLKELNLVLKADVQGSVEAIIGALKQLPQNEVQVRVLYAAPGEISETDVDLAAASDAVIIGFNTTLATGARQAADQAGVDVRDYNIIYKLLDDIQGAMEGLLEPELVEEPLGQLEVRAVFPVGKGAVAGCYVQSGKAIRNCKIRVHRGKEQVFAGNLDSLKRMKEDAKEVNTGFECGIGLDNFSAWQMGDIIETYRMVTKRRTLAR
jgi:translation initiation factor IF-2